MSASPRQTPLTPEEEAFLRAFSLAVLAVPRAFDEDLMRAQGLTTSEYLVLMHLSEAPDRRLRMTDLAAAAALSLSGMTRIVHRLGTDGSVRRERSPDDGRSWHAVLTDAGADRLQQAWPTHLASVRRHLLDHLSAVDLCSLTAALRSMAGHEGCSGPQPAPPRSDAPGA